MEKSRILKTINKEKTSNEFLEMKIIAIVILIVILLASRCHGVTVDTINEYSDRVATFYDIPKPILKAVISIESSYKIDAVSHKGAYGLMQVTLPAYKDYKRCNPSTYITNFAIVQDDWRANVAVGAWYLKRVCYKSKGSWKNAITSYFWGVWHSKPTLVYYNKIKKRMGDNG